MNIKDIGSRVMLATLNVSVWRARRFDTKATAEVENKHEAKDIGRFNKRLLTDGAMSYKDVCAIGNRARALFDARTLDYDQLGVRLMPTAVYMDVADRLRQYQDEFSTATERFLADYPHFMEEAKSALNDLFDEADYPTVAELRKKFGMRMSVLPFPDADQFDINLPHDVLVGLKGEMDDRVLSAVKTANDDLVGRLFEAVQHLANRLYQGTSVRLDVADKVRELCDLLPQLNFTADPTLTTILADAKTHLAVHSGAELKESPELRQQVAQKAMEIEAQMSAFMGGMPSFSMPAPAQAAPSAMVRLLSA
ncbi:hypothetical protein RA280_31450 [Cupriavidus sp. CV2]|uniref:hypothetical protein n=1 Tax=Cupriavidus ulmosensis TaxID=3065913 RepID=UPI00296AA350|nr:hypothetical protein [Cupriavidus sp. CV2]MDW3686179.1 hypothetical protein [Cupriavidus sp. CV2]